MGSQPFSNCFCLVPQTLSLFGLWMTNASGKGAHTARFLLCASLLFKTLFLKPEHFCYPWISKFFSPGQRDSWRLIQLSYPYSTLSAWFISVSGAFAHESANGLRQKAVWNVMFSSMSFSSPRDVDPLDTSSFNSSIAFQRDCSHILLGFCNCFYYEDWCASS